MIGLNYLGKMGQLGNQMFQYAALRVVADRRGLDYTVPNHNEVVEDDESILDLAISKFGNKRMLRWHYRSRHESLINFSNHLTIHCQNA